MRVEIPPAMRDEQWAARRKLVLQLDPAAAPEAKKKAGGKKAGRGRPAAKGCPESGQANPPSKEPNARAEQEALRRVEGSAEGTRAPSPPPSLSRSLSTSRIAFSDGDHQPLAEVGGTMGRPSSLALAPFVHVEYNVHMPKANDVDALDRLVTVRVTLADAQLLEEVTKGHAYARRTAVAREALRRGLAELQAEAGRARR